jgi:hypothetical protein
VHSEAWKSENKQYGWADIDCFVLKPRTFES